METSAEIAEMPEGLLETYIERLAGRPGSSGTIFSGSLEEITSSPAQQSSASIRGLLQRGLLGNRGRDKASPGWSHGARVELAFKVCYQQWVRSGVNVLKNKDMFVKNVMDTFQLLNEIADRTEISCETA